MSARRNIPLLLAALVALSLGHARAGSVSCPLAYDFPADIPVPTSQADNDTFQGFGWRSFLSLNAPSVGGQISTTGDNVPQWAAWSSTVDLLLCQGSPTPTGCICPSGNCGDSGTHYYPTACQAVPNHNNYRVLNQVSKVDDSFEEASTGGLSGDPVIDRFGGFLRYEIILSPATYADIIDQQLYDPAVLTSLTSNVNLSCGMSSYTGGDPANADMGALVLKNAWMDVTDALQNQQIDASMYHLEQLLVYTPPYRNSTGIATCDLRTMALVGTHIAHKTVNQPNWIWSTFEHTLNAPDCTGPIPGPNSHVANTSCPTTVATNYNLYGTSCSGGAKACAACNAAPATNGNCQNPDTSVGAGYCVDEPPNTTGGISQLCLQVPISEYPEAATWNSTCQTAIGTASVWGNYSLISSQWGTSMIQAGCSNVAAQIAGSMFAGPVDDSLILPKVAAGSASKPLLGNSSMESYDRSNCIGCHAKANFMNTSGTPTSTDLMYFLQLQVLAPAETRAAYAFDAAASSGGGGGGGNGGCNIRSDGRGGGASVSILLAFAAIGWRARRKSRSQR